MSIRIDHCGTMLYLSVVCWLLCNSVQLILGDDISTQLSCNFPPGVQVFPRENERQCFRRSVSPDLTECDYKLGRIYPRPVRYRANVAHIFSPNIRHRNHYRRNRLCQYNIGRRSSRQMTHFEWLSGEFALESPLPFGRCSDFVRFLRSELVTDPNLLPSPNVVQPVLDDIANLCGNQSTFQVQTTLLPINVEFLSDMTREYSGVHITFMHVSVDEFESRPTVRIRNTTGIKEEPDSSGQRPTVGQPNPLEEKPTTPTQCTRVPNSVPTEIPQIRRVYQRGNRISVPRHTFITYNRQVLQIVQGSRTLRRLRQIRYFVVKTGLDGIRVFRGTASVPKNEIFGGGILWIYPFVAYYVNYAIPPQYVPVEEECILISHLLQATIPLFAGKELKDDPTTPPFITEPPSREVFDPAVLSMAIEYENACNIFLRQAAKSFIDILTSEGLLPTKSDSEA